MDKATNSYTLVDGDISYLLILDTGWCLEKTDASGPGEPTVTEVCDPSAIDPFNPDGATFDIDGFTYTIIQVPCGSGST